MLVNVKLALGFNWWRFKPRFVGDRFHEGVCRELIWWCFLIFSSKGLEVVSRAVNQLKIELHDVLFNLAKDILGLVCILVYVQYFLKSLVYSEQINWNKCK